MKKETRWKPKVGDMYWCVSGWKYEVVLYEWTGGMLDMMALRLGNCYRTRKEAQAAAKRVKAAYKG